MDGWHHLDLAVHLARVMHEGQWRKGSGEPYNNHVVRVAVGVISGGWKAQTVAYLHDLVEDTPITLEMLRILRFPEDVISAVDAVTRRDGETYKEFINRTEASGDKLAWQVKLADLADNMRDIHLVPGGEGMKQKRYAEPYARFYKLVYGGSND